jgi:GNAT superfamily N-acetyltransferase
MDIRNPEPGEIAELTSLISSALGYTKEERGVAKDFPQLYQPSNSKHLWAAFEENKLLAHAGFYPAVMRVESLPLPVAGIGGVFTKEESQGQGLATKLLEKCTREAKRGGAALAFLWSDKHEFYGKQGFHLVGRQWTVALEPKHIPQLTQLGEKLGFPLSALQITDEKLDADLLRQTHAFLEIYPIGVARSPEEHAQYLESGSCRVISAWVGKQLAAYFVIGKGKDLQNYIHEWAGAEGALSHLAARCLTDFGHGLNLLSPQFMPDEVPWIYSLDEMGVSISAEYLALVKLLDFAKVKRLVHDYMKQLGLEESDLTIEESNGEYELTWRGGEAIVVDEAGFLRLLFGPELPENKEMQAFLPMRLWYWGMDSV